jgi:hypothetical protein
VTLYGYEEAQVFLSIKFNQEVAVRFEQTQDQIEDLCEEHFGTWFEQEALWGLADWVEGITRRPERYLPPNAK